MPSPALTAEQRDRLIQHLRDAHHVPGRELEGLNPAQLLARHQTRVPHLHEHDWETLPSWQDLGDAALAAELARHLRETHKVQSGPAVSLEDLRRSHDLACRVNVVSASTACTAYAADAETATWCEQQAALNEGLSKHVRNMHPELDSTQPREFLNAAHAAWHRANPGQAHLHEWERPPDLPTRAQLVVHVIVYHRPEAGRAVDSCTKDDIAAIHEREHAQGSLHSNAHPWEWPEEEPAGEGAAQGYEALRAAAAEAFRQLRPDPAVIAAFTEEQADQVDTDLDHVENAIRLLRRLLVRVRTRRA